ncbi:hypothetical protein DFS33DRAFT_1310022 [Desarmillaria ectypa]|nr:hypothetical protein DFS33DRAFT_1310022 [Desarmillaria ectypa]
MKDSETPFIGDFIRAPVVLQLSCSPEDTPIQNFLPLALSGLDDSDPKTIVFLRQGYHLLTTFHLELTPDDRFHDYFVRHYVLSTT